jgi:aminopeptidase N
LHGEPEELNLKIITGYLGDIFWRLTTKDERLSLAGDLEKELWQAMLDEPDFQ